MKVALIKLGVFKGITTAAERQKICSPRRQPWVWVGANEIAAERRNSKRHHRCSAPAGAGLLLAFLSHGSRHGLQIFLPLRGC